MDKADIIEIKGRIKVEELEPTKHLKVEAIAEDEHVRQSSKSYREKKKLYIECKTCNYQMTLVADDPLKGFDYLTNGNRICKKCSNKLLFEI